MHSFALLLNFIAGYEEIYAYERQNAPFNILNNKFIIVNETKKQVVDALVFVGDCVEEDIDELGRVSGELGLLGVPIFVFQEGYDKVAEFAFKQITKLSNGAYCRLDQFSAKTLRELLSAVAVFAAGGKIALDNYAKKNGGVVLQIAHQMKGR